MTNSILSITHKQLAEDVKEKALEAGRTTPVIIVDGSGVSGLIPLDNLPEGYTNKARMLYKIGEAVAQQENIGELMRVTAITEAWMSVIDGGEEIEVRPSEDPKRKEVLIIGTLSVRDDKTEVSVYQIKRDKKGKIVKLTEYLKDKDKTSVSAPLLKFFEMGFAHGSGSTLAVEREEDRKIIIS